MPPLQLLYTRGFILAHQQERQRQKQQHHNQHSTPTFHNRLATEYIPFSASIRIFHFDFDPPPSGTTWLGSTTSPAATSSGSNLASYKRRQPSYLADCQLQMIEHNHLRTIENVQLPALENHNIPTVENDPLKDLSKPGFMACYFRAMDPLIGQSGSLACYSGSLACYSGLLACYSGSLACYSGSLACYSGSLARYSGSLACYSGSLARYSGSLACYSGSNISLLWTSQTVLTKCQANFPFSKLKYR
ncbi:hypothetical protein Ancab_023760 [Ancistrocladus abbreviatus]